MIQKLRHPVVAPTGVGKNDGSMMHRGGWWSKRWCMMVLVQDLYLMLQFLGLLPQATAWNSQKISIIMFSVCSTNIFSFLLNTSRMMTTTHWSAKTWCNRKALPTSLKCLKNGWRNCWIVRYKTLCVLNVKALVGSFEGLLHDCEICKLLYFRLSFSIPDPDNHSWSRSWLRLCSTQLQLSVSPAPGLAPTPCGPQDN